MQNYEDSICETDELKLIKTMGRRRNLTVVWCKTGRFPFAQFVDFRAMPIRWQKMQPNQNELNYKPLRFVVGSKPVSVRVNGSKLHFFCNKIPVIEIFVSELMLSKPSGLFQLMVDIEFKNVTLRRRVVIKHKSLQSSLLESKQSLKDHFLRLLFQEKTGVVDD